MKIPPRGMDFIEKTTISIQKPLFWGGHKKQATQSNQLPTDTASANTENTETTRFPTDKNKLSQARKICSNLLRKLLYMEWISKKIAKTCQKLLYMEWFRSKKCQKCDQSCASNMLIGSAQHAKHFALKLPLLCACIYAQEHTSY